jgi:hypothetical protein
MEDDQIKHLGSQLKNSNPNHTYNRFPHSALGCSPFELWYGCKPNVPNLRVWGCFAYVHVQKNQRQEPKHETHTRLCNFIDYRDDYKDWEFLKHETGNRVISREVHLAGECIQKCTIE